MQRRPENVAAIVNGLVVLLGPIALFWFLAALRGPGESNTSSVVTAVDPAGSAEAIYFFGTVAMVLAPFALVAGWRTRVHAQRWLRGQGRGWQGVAEAGVLGAAVAIAYLLQGILTKPLEAPPYVIVYGGAALVLGLLAGLILRVTGVATLKLMGSDGN